MNLEANQIEAARAQLRHDIQLELTNNRLGFLDKTYPALAASFPDSFPDLGIANLYLQPTTSWSDSTTEVEPFDWRPREPSIVSILNFAAERLNWKREHALKRLHSNVFEGAAVRMLASVLSIIYMGRMLTC